MSVYNKRLTAPGKDSKYYYADNVFYQSNYGMPNCTAYAWGRWYELLGTKPKLCLSDAKNWYGYNDGYVRSGTPKLGAIACWSGGQYGHIAVVEQINADGTMVISESDYVQKILFDTKTIKQNSNIYGYAFQGYIIPPVEFTANVPQPTPSSSTGNYKVIEPKGMNVRTGPGTNYPIKPLSQLSADAQKQGGYVNGVIFTVYEVKPSEDGVNKYWGRTPSGWVCIDSQFCVKV